MTNKQRMLAVIAGEQVDKIPYAPRLDLWYLANKRAGTLPAKYRHASLAEIVDDLDMGYHAVVPNFQDLRSGEDDIGRPLGIWNLWFMPYRTIFEGVRCTTRVQGDRTFVQYETPAGPIGTVTLYNETMRKAGITITHVEEHAFKGPQDYAALGYLFENMRIESNYDGYLEFARQVGDRGLAVGYVSLAGSPMHLIQREIMPLETFFYEMHDHPDELAELQTKVELYWQRIFEVVCNCPAEILLVGGNYDASVTYPPFFKQHIQPWLHGCAERLHDKGKYLLTHTDGENTGLLELYLAAQIDIADSICPAPMTKLTFKQVRNAFAGEITIMGGIPSVSLLKSSMSATSFEQFLDNFFTMIGKGDHLIVGISDTTPPAADFDRILRIKERLYSFRG